MRKVEFRRALAAVALLLLTLAAVPGRALAAEPAPPFRDPSLPLETRVADLVDRLTLDEKISLLHQYQPAIPRLGIKLFKAGTEALHGIAWSNDVDHNGDVVTATGTVFPQPVGLASTWDPELLERVGNAVGDEARGYNKINDRVWGLNLWAPVVNLLRDPRWGRNEEGYSEDPFLTGEISTAYGTGLTGGDPGHLKTAPTLKHYLAYNNEARRDVSSSNLPQRVLNEYDRAAFKPALEADAATGVMASYNLVNGRPATVDPDLATIERSWSDYPLFNVTDAYAPYNLTGSQQYYATQAEASAAIIKAGLDSFTVDNTDGGPTIASVKAALAQGLLTERDIDRAAGHALSIRFRLGEFDPDGGPYAGIGPEVVNSPAHQRLARETAAEAAVLLKNQKQALPLKPGGKVAVVGPLSDTLYNDWYGGKLPYQVTVADGIRERASAVTQSEGSDRIALKDVTTGRYVTAGGTTDTTPVTVTGTGATANAQFDVVDWGQDVVTLRNVGTGRYLGSGGGGFVTRDEQPSGWYVQQQFKIEAQGDGTVVLRYAGYETSESWFGSNVYLTVSADGRLVLGSPDAAGAAHFTREVLVDGIAQAVAAAKAADNAVVVVGSMPFINGREIKDRTSTALAAGQSELVKAVLRANPRTTVVLQTSYPDSITWEQDHVPAILWTTHAGAETGHAVADVLYGKVNPSGKVTQTWYRSDDQLPPDLYEYDIIGSKQTYLYSTAKPLYPFGHGLSYTSFKYSNLKVRGTKVSVDVTNKGKVAGDEVVQLYTHQRTSRDVQPVKELRAFDKVHVAPGRTKTVTLSFDRADLAHWDVTRQRWVVETATHDVLVGSSSADIRVRGSLAVRGETIPPRDLTRSTRAEAFDTYAGVRLVDETKARGTAVGSTADGQWVGYRDARFGRTFTASVAKESAGTGTIQIRRGSPTGPVLGTVTVPSTGSRYAYTSVTAPVARGSGDLYLLLSNGIRIADFRIQ
ncbi:glycoside hydrolase family 3 protein [Symbioplanes lichenis]|uniref:glycoside hydrolase family 3 protein n=1 Tax=Symbioplanes lichenis TaxID=1629072 RepID=UPI00273A211D|nr:glycoside hydrolase family 3 protein [Actinoplanes lichenis]